MDPVLFLVSILIGVALALLIGFVVCRISRPKVTEEQLADLDGYALPGALAAYLLDRWTQGG